MPVLGCFYLVDFTRLFFSMYCCIFPCYSGMEMRLLCCYKSPPIKDHIIILTSFPHYGFYRERLCFVLLLQKEQLDRRYYGVDVIGRLVTNIFEFLLEFLQKIRHCLNHAETVMRWPELAWISPIHKIHMVVIRRSPIYYYRVLEEKVNRIENLPWQSSSAEILVGVVSLLE